MHVIGTAFGGALIGAGLGAILFGWSGWTMAAAIVGALAGLL